MKSSKSSKEHSEDRRPSISERDKLIGLGRRSVSKSYYPELKARLDELEQFRALLDRVSDAIFVLDADTGVIIDVSGSTNALIGCEKATLTGTDFKKLLPPYIRRHAANLFHNHTRNIHLETELHHPDCEKCVPVPVDMSIQIIGLEESRRVIIVARDIRERKEAEKALKKSHDQLEIRVRERTSQLDRANKAKSEFIAMVSHELRTPLTSILGFAKIIKKKLRNTIYPVIETTDKKVLNEMERIARNIDIIYTESTRLTALINDVLDLSKLEANKMDYKFTTLKPMDFINRSLEATEALLRDSELLLFLELEPGLPLVRGDENRLIQVMVNLLSNAVKFTPKGSITCRASHVGDSVRVSVIDTGLGIPAESIDSIFNKFTQVQEEQSEQPRGTGLGLSISKHIIEAHGGQIWAASQVNKGSEFVFTIPVIKDYSDLDDR